MNYKTPGVYVEETSLLPPSVAQVETAIPAFIGYTEKGPTEPTRITSMLEYNQQFGGPHAQKFEVTLADDAPYLPQSVAINSESPYLMYYALQMFFANGGGPCYIVSVGNYETEPRLDDLSDYDEIKGGLSKIRKVDEVTLLVIPEATRLQTTTQYDLYKDVLMQCGELKDRFGIFDVRRTDTSADEFRNNIGTNFLSYGAAYYPHLKSTLQYHYHDAGITFTHSESNAFDGFTLEEVRTLGTALDMQKQFDAAKQNITAATTTGQNGVQKVKFAQIEISLSNMEKAVNSVKRAMALVDGFTSSEFDSAKSVYETQNEKSRTGSTNDQLDDDLQAISDASDDLETAMEAVITALNKPNQTTIPAANNSIIGTHFTSEFMATLNGLLTKERITMPPSPILAGIYAKVDEGRGVWKAPANVSINQVSGPSVKLTMDDNDRLNVDPSGKSINAIRAFTGKGTLVWGARTLDGNSTEWKYVPVRRFFNMVEESVKKASEPFVFETNDANTWVKVKAMIENFLTVQWRAGALMGAKPEQAFFVKVGLGETMTQQNVLNGEMIVEIGLAVVRPAEFIVLRFSHKMLES